MIDEAELLLRAGIRGMVGRYQLEGALQSAHVDRYRTGLANWAEVVALTMRSSRCPALRWWRSTGPWRSRRGRAPRRVLRHSEVVSDQRLAEYQPYWAARAELLGKTGAREEARQAYEIAIGLERDPAVRRFLQERQAALTAEETKLPDPR